MALDFTGSPGGLMRRLGRYFFALKSANTFLGNGDISAGGLKAIGISTTDILAQFQSSLPQINDGLVQQRDAVRQTLASWKFDLATRARNTLIEQVHADAVLTEKSLGAALRETIRQMAGAGSVFVPDNSVDASTVSATAAPVTVPANTGNGALAVSTLRRDGRANEHVLAEVMEAVCTGDSQLGGPGSARRESFTARGEVPVGDPLAFDWPAGSGSSTVLTAIDAGQDASGGNLLYNSDFDGFATVNQPDYWGAPLVGAYGTDLFEEGVVVYRPGKALRFTGTAGAPLSSVAQSFGVTTPAVGTSGTTSTLRPNTVYAFCAFVRKSAGLGAGSVQFRLLDGANAEVNDDAGNANAVGFAHGALTTSFAAYTGFFRTPKLLPTTLKFNARVSVALTSGEHVYVDDLAFAEATELYASGPLAALFAGSINFLLGDQINVTVTNDRAGEFQEWFERVFGMRSLGLQLPSNAAGGETVQDNLIS